MVIDHDIERQDCLIQIQQRYHVKVRYGQIQIIVYICEKGINQDQSMTGAGETEEQ